MLPAGAAGVELVEAVVVGVEGDLDVLGLGHDGDGGGGGVDAALGLGLGDALDAVAAALVLELAEDALALHAERDFLEAAELGGAVVEDLDLPALVLGVLLVHLVQVACEEGRLVAAGAGADLHDAPGAVGVGPAEGLLQEVVPERLALGGELVDLRLGQLAHVGVAFGGHLTRLGDLVVHLFEAAVLGGELGQRTLLAGHGRKTRGVGQDLGVDHLPLQLLEPGELFFQEVAHRGAGGRVLG